MKSLLRSLAAACAIVVMATSGTLAEWKPSGPITMMIAFAAGGGADTQARMIAEELEKRHGWKIIPEQSDEQLREIIANTYGQIALIDHQVGRLMNCLDELGLADNTIVVYGSDHGDWLGDHGLVLKGPMHYEWLLRVPLIMRGPDIGAGAVNDNPVSTMDLAATFADYAGAEPLLAQNGSSLRPLLETGASRECARNEWDLLPTRAGVQLSLRTVRTRTAKMTKDLISGAGEMYDLASDPHEMTNLFDDPAHAAMKAELEALIDMRPDDMLPLQTQVGMA